MTIYFRKSLSAGPFRVNFSSHGVGASVGIKGLRVGTGPRGHYVQAGLGGIYYRTAFGRPPRNDPPSTPKPVHGGPRRSEVVDERVRMVDIESGDVGHMRSESFDAFLAELNDRRARAPLTLPVMLILAAITAVVAASGSVLWILPAIAMLPALLMLRRIDARRRITVIAYDLRGPIEDAYSALCESFDHLMSCAGKWHIPSAGRVTDMRTWKRNAGASNLVNRTDTALSYELPAEIKSNLKAPALKVGRQVLHFLPDVVLVQDGRRLGGIAYDQLEAHVTRSRFIEAGRPPRDATVVEHAWQHPNKNGGPDRRFSSNRRLPVCLYGSIWLRSGTGLEELVEFSVPEKAERFARSLGTLAAAVSSTGHITLERS